jgi:hypothetical protein
MDELFKEVFDSLPHVDAIWVLPNGDYYLHPFKGAEKYNRINVVEVEKKKPTKKK